MSFILLFIVLLSSNELISAEINDVKCDAQLEFFNQALSKRDRWSVDCESCYTYEKILI